MKDWKELEEKYQKLIDHILGLDIYPEKREMSKEIRDKLHQKFWEEIQIDAYREGYEDCLNKQTTKYLYEDNV